MERPPLRVEGVSRDPSKPIAIVAFNRVLTSDEMLALHSMLTVYVNTPATRPEGG